jgi:O-antigen ligase
MVVIWQDRLRISPSGTTVLKLAIGIVMTIAILQVLPLPLSWIEAVSPERYLWLQRSLTVSSLEPTWTSLSYTPLITVFTVAWWAFLILFALVLYHSLPDRRQANRLFSLLMLLAVVETLYGLLQTMLPSMNVLWTNIDAYRGCARGTFINRNHFAAYLTMLWPLFLAWILTMRPSASRPNKKLSSQDLQQHRQKRIFFCFLLGLMLLAIAFSRSRAGLASSLMAVTVFIVLSRPKKREIWAFLGGCWGLVLTYGWILGPNEIISRFNQIVEQSSGRLLIWQDTLGMIKKHLLTGTGLGSQLTVFQLYQTHLPENKWISHAHNDYLQLGAELGIPAAALLIVAAGIYWFRQAHRIRKLSKGRPPREVIWAAGALSGASGFMAHSLVDFNWQIPANQVTFLMLLVLASRFITNGTKCLKPDSK